MVLKTSEMDILNQMENSTRKDGSQMNVTRRFKDFIKLLWKLFRKMTLKMLL